MTYSGQPIRKLRFMVMDIAFREKKSPPGPLLTRHKASGTLFLTHTKIFMTFNGSKWLFPFSVMHYELLVRYQSIAGDRCLDIFIWDNISLPFFHPRVILIPQSIVQKNISAFPRITKKCCCLSLQYQ